MCLFINFCLFRHQCGGLVTFCDTDRLLSFVPSVDQLLGPPTELVDWMLE